MPRFRDRDGFASSWLRGRAFACWHRVAGDLVTAVAAYLKLRAALDGPAFLLESVEGGSARGRYSIIGLAPDLIWRCHEGRSEIDRDARDGTGTFSPIEEPALEAVRRLIAESEVKLDEGLPPMSAGLFGYLGYDLVREMERLGPPKPSPVGVPDAILVRPTILVIFDHVRDEISVVHTVRPSAGGDLDRAFAGSQAAIEAVLQRLEEAIPHVPGARPRLGAASVTPASNLSGDEFGAMVAAAKKHIAAGDIFQAVLSQLFQASFPLPPVELYRSLRRINPAPFLCYLDFEDFQIVCSSPEILVRVRDGVVTVRPIAGTRPRGATGAEDERLAAELLADPKERAEHLMLLDLGRNDVGRVAELGTVEVTESFLIERYSQVMHIVSNVTGRLRADRDGVDALVAGFPAGTVSGAPKIRAMQIIDDLEPCGRGPYAGCIGYFGPRGQMDTCIVLRTAGVRDGMMYVQAGAGIVHDSDAASEAQECVNTAGALFRAAADALRRAAPDVGE